MRCVGLIMSGARVLSVGLEVEMEIETCTDLFVNALQALRVLSIAEVATELYHYRLEALLKTRYVDAVKVVGVIYRVVSVVTMRCTGEVRVERVLLHEARVLEAVSMQMGDSRGGGIC